MNELATLEYPYIIKNNDIDEDIVTKDDNINIYLVSSIILLIVITTSGLIYIILKTKKA